jgi:hypothetical protein
VQIHTARHKPRQLNIARRGLSRVFALLEPARRLAAVQIWRIEEPALGALLLRPYRRRLHLRLPADFRFLEQALAFLVRDHAARHVLEDVDLALPSTLTFDVKVRSACESGHVSSAGMPDTPSARCGTPHPPPAFTASAIGAA